MKKILHRVLLCGMFIVCFSTMMSVTAFAANAGLTGPTDEFIDVCNSLFTEGSGYKAIDQNGDDVTEEFVQDYRDEYLSGNLAVIWEAVGDDLSCITWERDVPQPYFYITDTVKSKGIYRHDKTEEHGKDFEMIYYVSGTFKYHDGTGQIIECDDGVIEVDYFNAGALFSYTQYGTSTSGTISSDKKSVEFSGKFYITLHCGHPQFTGFDLWTEDIGPYEGNVTGYSV